MLVRPILLAFLGVALASSLAVAQDQVYQTTTAPGPLAFFTKPISESSMSLPQGSSVTIELNVTLAPGDPSGNATLRVDVVPAPPPPPGQGAVVVQRSAEVLQGAAPSVPGLHANLSATTVDFTSGPIQVVDLTLQVDPDAPAGEAALVMVGLQTPYSSGARGMEITVVAAPHATAGAEAAWLAGGALGGVILLAVGSATARRRVFELLGLLVPLYTRLSKPRVAQHPKRRDLLERIGRQPGITTRDLQIDTRLSDGVLAHHLRVLEANRFIVSWKAGAQRHFFVAGAGSGAARTLAPTRLQRQVLQLIGTAGATRRDVQEGLGLTQQGASYHLTTLQRAGWVRLDDDGAGWRYALTEEGRLALADGRSAGAGGNRSDGPGGADRART